MSFDPDKYIVFKRTDVNDALSSEQKRQLKAITSRIGAHRDQRGAKADMPCVVVEADWPEFEPTKAAVLARATAAQPAPMADTTYRCADHRYGGSCPNCERKGTSKL